MARNLLLGTGTLTHVNGETSFNGGEYTGTFRGCQSYKTNRAWCGYYIDLKKVLPKAGLKIGDTLTYSMWAMIEGAPVRDVRFSLYRTGTSPYPRLLVKKDEVKSGEWFRIPLQFTITEDTYTTTAGMRLECDYYSNSDYTMGDVSVWFACPMLTIGEDAPDWQPAPEDVTYNIPQDIELGSLKLTAGEPFQKADDTYCIRSASPVDAYSTDFMMAVPDGYELIVNDYGSDGTLIGRSMNWMVPESGYVSLKLTNGTTQIGYIFKRSDNGEITNNDIKIISGGYLEHD